MQFGFRLGLGTMQSAVAPADPYAHLYGTGLYQIPLRLTPQDAVLDGSGNVVSVPNRGGAGAPFAATASTTGIARSGGLFSISTAGAFLQLAAPADLVGARVFFVARVDPAAEQSAPRFAGRNAGAAAGGRTEIHLTAPGTAFGVRRFDGTSTIFAQTGTFAGVAGSGMRLYELEFSAGSLRVWVNGAETSPTALAWPDMLIDRLFAGFNSPGFVGQSGDILSVITDGSAAADPVMAQVRALLAAEYGIAMP